MITEPLRSVSIVTPALPPQLNGIGDYTARLASHLRGSVSVKLLTPQGVEHTDIPGVAIEPTFCPEHPRSVRGIARHVEAGRPHWLLLQYNPFSYGRWGLNPHLPLVIRTIKRRNPETRFALMVHEPYVPVSSAKFAVMTTWQRWQLWMLGRAADVVFFSIEPWTNKFRRWFPGKPVLHLPVGSNVPRVPISRDEARTRLGIRPGTRVLGLFGTAHASRLLEPVRLSAQRAAREGSPVVVLYIGPHGPAVRQALKDVPLLAEGPLAPDEVSRRLAAVDVYLAPYFDGISTRRGAAMAGLQHALPTVGTTGFLTDEMLLKENGHAFLLADVSGHEQFSGHVLRLLKDAGLCESLGRAAQQLYRTEFVWERIASRLLSALDAVDSSAPKEKGEIERCERE